MHGDEDNRVILVRVVIIDCLILIQTLCFRIMFIGCVQHTCFTFAMRCTHQPHGKVASLLENLPAAPRRHDRTADAIQIRQDCAAGCTDAWTRGCSRCGATRRLKCAALPSTPRQLHDSQPWLGRQRAPEPNLPFIARRWHPRYHKLHTGHLMAAPLFPSCQFLVIEVLHVPSLQHFRLPRERRHRL